MLRLRFLSLFSCSVLSLVLLNGCDDKKSAPAGPPTQNSKSGAPGAPGQTGRMVFDQHCANCHAVGEVAARGKGGAPNLGKVAADATHTREWLTAYINDPKSKKPDSKMPPFNGKVDNASMEKLLDYLLEQK